MVQFPSKKHITMKKEDGMMGNLSGYLVGVSIFLKTNFTPYLGEIIQIVHPGDSSRAQTSSPILGGHVFTPWFRVTFSLTIPKKSLLESPGILH